MSFNDVGVFIKEESSFNFLEVVDSFDSVLLK